MKHLVLCIFLMIAGTVRAQDQSSGALFPFRQTVEKYNFESLSAGSSSIAKKMKPPLRVERLVLESAAGFAGGIIGMYTFWTLGNEMDSGGGEWLTDSGSIMGVLIGYPLGTAGGVYLAGSIGDQTGSFGATVLGSLAGFWGGVLIAGAVNDIAPFLITSVVTPVIAFNLTRKYKDGRGPSLEDFTLRTQNIGHGQPALLNANRLPGPEDTGVNIFKISIPL